MPYLLIITGGGGKLKYKTIFKDLARYAIIFYSLCKLIIKIEHLQQNKNEEITLLSKCGI